MCVCMLYVCVVCVWVGGGRLIKEYICESEMLRSDLLSEYTNRP